MPQVSIGARWIAAGILCTRLTGFLRDRLLAHYFGLGPHADVFRVALRGPNMLQNLLGEGTLSASFIPVYTRLRRDGRVVEARRFAGAILGLLVAVVAGIVLLGILLAPALVAALAPGFLSGPNRAGVDRYALTVRAVRWMFPMTGFLVLAAWTLAVLNSHRRFLLPYLAPVAWNAAIAAAVIWAVRGGRADSLDDLLIAACGGALAGGFLQFVIQVPAALRLVGGLRLSSPRGTAGVSEALATFGPAVVARGAVQLSAYLDLLLASFLAAGAIGALGIASSLYILPISVFAMSVSAAELPELAAAAGGQNEEAWREFRRRIAAGLTQTGFLTIPSAIGYLCFGSWIVGALYETGAFGAAETRLTHWVLAAYSLGLVASGASRLLQNAFYAAGHPRSPARVALARMLVSAAAGLPAMLLLDRFAVPGAGADSVLRLGAVGLAVASALAAWVEVLLLARALRRAVHRFSLPWGRWARLGALAAACALAGTAAGWWLQRRDAPLWVQAGAVIAVYGGSYVGLAARLGFEEGGSWLGRFGRLPRLPRFRRSPPS